MQGHPLLPGPCTMSFLICCVSSIQLFLNCFLYKRLVTSQECDFLGSMNDENDKFYHCSAEPKEEAMEILLIRCIDEWPLRLGLLS